MSVSNCIIEILMMIPLAFVLLCLYWSGDLSDRGVHVYRVAVIMCIIQLPVEAVGNLTMLLGGPRWRLLNLVLNYIFFVLDILVPYVMLVMVLYQCKLERLAKRWAIPAIVTIAALALNPATGWCFTISPENIYRRGPYNFFTPLVAVVYTVALVVYATRRMQRYTRREKVFVLLALLTMILGVVLQSVFSVSCMWIMVAVAMFMFYVCLRNMEFQLDSLTGLENRDQFALRMREFSRERSVWIIMADMNCLKLINDRYGHDQGDEAICQVARALNGQFGEFGIICRIGGDEFCLLCPDVRLSEKGIGVRMKLAEETLGVLHQLVPVEGIISYGAARYEGPGSTKTIEQVQVEADDAMYAMKNAVELVLREK